MAALTDSPSKSPEVASSAWQMGRRSEVHDRFIEIAIELIADKGLEGFTYGDVAERAACSRSLPGHYFTSKADLVRLAVLDLLGRQKVHLEQLGLEPMFAIVAHSFTSVLSYPVRVRALCVVLADARADAPFNSEVVGYHTERQSAIQQHLKAAIETRVISASIDVDATARAIMATIRGAVLLELQSPGSLNPADVAASYVAGLRRSLAPPTLAAATAT
jgi:AcrR family transcriptional regulator